MHTVLRAILVVGLLQTSAVHLAQAAPDRLDLAPLQPETGYPVRIRLLNANEIAWRVAKLEAKNPGWKITVNGSGYISSAQQTFAATSPLRADYWRWYRSGTLPAKRLKAIKSFITANRKQLAANVKHLRTVIALGGPMGAPTWTLHFSRRAPRTIRKRLSKPWLSRKKLRARLLRGRRLLVERTLCPPCRPGGNCTCSNDVLLDKPATRSTTKISVRLADFTQNPGFVETRLVASVWTNSATVRKLSRRYPNTTIRLGYKENVRSIQYLDAIDGSVLDPAYPPRDHQRVKPGIYLTGRQFYNPKRVD